MSGLNQYFEAEHISPEQLDMLLADGWRHFGPLFFRYDQYQASPEGPRQDVMPLRLPLAAFRPARRHRRILQQNADLYCQIEPVRIQAEHQALFERHRQRFTTNQPESLMDFLGPTPATRPCPAKQLCAYWQGQLVATAFLDLAAQSTSGIYSIFDPELKQRGLGIFLILQSIAYSQQLGKTWYYPGYAYHQASHYDYKKQFQGLEFFDWANWQELKLC